MNNFVIENRTINNSHSLYHKSGFFSNLLDFYVKPVLYRWTVNTKALDISLEGVQPETLKKDFMAYAARISQLNIGNSLHRLLLKMLLEDAVFGYWLEGDENPALFYLPSHWCTIWPDLNGGWRYHIDGAKIPEKSMDELPEELQSLLRDSMGKSGQETLVAVPPEKSLCIKYNHHTSRIFPPFAYANSLLDDLSKAKKIDLAKDKQDAANLIQMRIPIDDNHDDHLKLTEPLVKQFATGLQDLLPPNSTVLPTPMELTPLSSRQGQETGKNMVQRAMQAFNEETGIPSFGAANDVAGQKLTIQNAMSKMFALLDQISQAINLKMKLDGWNNHDAYQFEYQILHMNTFNEEEVISQLLKQHQTESGSLFTLAAAGGQDPTTFVGQRSLEAAFSFQQ